MPCCWLVYRDKGRTAARDRDWNRGQVRGGRDSDLAGRGEAEEMTVAAGEGRLSRQKERSDRPKSEENLAPKKWWWCWWDWNGGGEGGDGEAVYSRIF